jgi:2-hydroxyacyl-CoA lyase 1
MEIAKTIKAAKAPLVVIGKGAAYAKAELAIRELIDKSKIPFLPTPMGKGVIADSHPLNAASARSTALKEADVVLLLGARLNWILHFGEPPKWNSSAVFIQIDISAEEIGRNGGEASLSIIGDLCVVIPQLIRALGPWSYIPSVSPYTKHLAAAKIANTEIASRKALSIALPMTYARALSTIERTLHRLSPAELGAIVYVSEGANTMDISRSIFPVSHPRLRLDAGTHATMGVGLGYAIAAHAAYNSSSPEAIFGPPGRKKKIVALEGDSAFGFSAMEVETMARYEMDILIFVMNNSGVYHGDSNDAQEWTQLQKATTTTWQPHRSHTPPATLATPNHHLPGLRSTSLGFEVGYEKLAEMCGGLGFLVRTPEELERATEAGWRSSKVCVVNVIIEAGKGGKLEFGWQGGGKGKGKGKKKDGGGELESKL